MTIRMAIEIEMLQALKEKAVENVIDIDVMSAAITLSKITDKELLDLRAMMVDLDEHFGDTMHDLGGLKAVILDDPTGKGFSPRSHGWYKI